MTIARNIVASNDNIISMIIEANNLAISKTLQTGHDSTKPIQNNSEFIFSDNSSLTFDCYINEIGAYR